MRGPSASGRAARSLRWKPVTHSPCQGGRPQSAPFTVYTRTHTPAVSHSSSHLHLNVCKHMITKIYIYTHRWWEIAQVLAFHTNPTSRSCHTQPVMYPHTYFLLLVCPCYVVGSGNKSWSQFHTTDCLRPSAAMFFEPLVSQGTYFTFGKSHSPSPNKNVRK